MRDIKRIDRMLDKIKGYWGTNPDMRFYQMMINLGLIEDKIEYWRMEDDVLEKHIDKMLKKRIR